MVSMLNKASSFVIVLALISKGIRLSFTTAVANKLKAAVMLIPNDSHMRSKLFFRFSSILMLKAVVVIIL